MEKFVALTYSESQYSTKSTPKYPKKIYQSIQKMQYLLEFNFNQHETGHGACPTSWHCWPTE